MSNAKRQARRRAEREKEKQKLEYDLIFPPNYTNRDWRRGGKKLRREFHGMLSASNSLTEFKRYNTKREIDEEIADYNMREETKQ